MYGRKGNVWSWGTGLSAGLLLLALSGLPVSVLRADVVTFRSGKVVSNVRTKVQRSSVVMVFPDGRSEEVSKRLLLRLQVLPVQLTGPDATAPGGDAERTALLRKEAERVARTTARGDTWQPRPSAQQVSTSSNFARGLIPVYSGLYRTEDTKSALAFSALEGLLLVNLLDIATARPPEPKLGRLDFLAGGLVYLDLTADGILAPAISGAPLYYLSGTLTGQIGDVRGGLTGRRIVGKAATDFPPWSKQKQALRKARREAGAALALVLLADGMVSALAAQDWNQGQWTGKKGMPPTTAVGRALRSLVFPGWGQYHGGGKTKGVVFSSVGGGLLLASAIQNRRYRAAQQNYRNSYDEMIVYGGIGKFLGYSDAVGFGLTGAIIDPLRRAVSKQEGNFKTAASVTAGFWLWNVIDAMVFDPRRKTSLTIKPMVDLARPTGRPSQTSEQRYSLAAELSF